MGDVSGVTQEVIIHQQYTSQNIYKKTAY